MSFLLRVEELSLIIRIRSLVIWEGGGVLRDNLIILSRLASVSSEMGWRTWPGRRRFGVLCLDCCLCEPDMDGWTDGRMARWPDGRMAG